MSEKLCIDFRDLKSGFEIIQKYLSSQCHLLRIWYKKYPKKIIENSTLTAVIVEPRSNHPLLEAVCRNVMYFLPKDANLIIWSHDQNLIRNSLQDIDFSFNKLEKDNFNQDEYSSLLMSLDFWKCIQTKHVIIFQTDSYMTRSLSNQEFNKISKYPFIGAPYRIDHNEKTTIDLSLNNRDFSINGGFSYRNRDAMIECIQKVSLKDIIEYRIKNNYNLNYMIKNEDVYFENALLILKYSLPLFSECSNFCIQSMYDLSNSLAIHGIDKEYVYRSFIFHLRPSLVNFFEEINHK